MSRNDVERDTFTVLPYRGGWAVEHHGDFSEPTPSKEEAKASANKQARAAQDAGRPCRVQVCGEHGFVAALAAMGDRT